MNIAELIFRSLYELSESIANEALPFCTICDFLLFFKAILMLDNTSGATFEKGARILRLFE